MLETRRRADTEAVAPVIVQDGDERAEPVRHAHQQRGVRRRRQLLRRQGAAARRAPHRPRPRGHGGHGPGE